MIIRRDLGTGVTINVDNFALPEKYAQAVLLGVAICEDNAFFRDAVVFSTTGPWSSFFTV